MDITKTHSSHMPSMTSHLPTPNHGLETATQNGHNVLWVVFGAMLLSTLVFFGLSFRRAKRDRLFFYITGLVTMMAAISYYSMAIGFGSVLVPARGPKHVGVHNFREVLPARYYDWLGTTPLLLLDLAFFAGIAPMDMILLVIADVLMVVTGYFASITVGLGHRMGFYAMSCIFMLIVFGFLLVNGSSAAKARGDKVKNAYFILMMMTIVLWCAYPIVWMFSEGLNVIHSDTEIYLYTILDVLAKPGFGGLLLLFHARIEEMETSLPAWFVEPSAGSESYSILPQHE